MVVFFGLCDGEKCVEIFVLESDRLLEDVNDRYPYTQLGWDSSDGLYIDLGNEKFDLVKDLMDFFPVELLDETQEVFGCPDCSDGGGIYIEYKFIGIERSWIIDYNWNPGVVPDYLHNFMYKVEEKIQIIND